MGWSGGGGSANPDNETIKTNVQGQLYVVPNPAAAGETSANGVGVLFDDATITLNASNQLQINLANANTWTAAQTFPIATYNNLLSNANTWTAAQTFPIATYNNLLSNANTWTAAQTFPIATYNNLLSNANTWTATQTFPVASFSNLLSTANTWTAVQNFGTSNLELGGATIALTTLAPNQALMYNGTNWVNQEVVVSVTDQAKTSELELTSTSATTVATYTPSASGNFVLFVYARVVTAATTLTLTASWTDAAGAQTYTWLNAVSEPVGSYTFLPLFINSTASAITITATAGTANQVYCSANIVSLS
ncbi:MAG: hypothetical protein QW478_10665 [Candidatus Micrarchaeaceae archaeon]